MDKVPTNKQIIMESQLLADDVLRCIPKPLRAIDDSYLIFEYIRDYNIPMDFYSSGTDLENTARVSRVFLDFSIKIKKNF